MEFLLFAGAAIALAFVVRSGSLSRRRANIQVALEAFNNDVPKIRVESIIRTALQFGQSRGRYGGVIEKESRSLQLIAAAWELGEMARPGIISLAGSGSIAERSAILNCTLAIWTYLADHGMWGPDGSDPLGDASVVSINYYFRIHDDALMDSLLQLANELGKDNDDFIDKIHSALAKISAVPGDNDLSTISALIDERIEHASRIVGADLSAVAT